MNIYYDPTDGVLMTPDNKGGYTVVQTNAQLDPSRISLSKEGYLTLFDFEGHPHTMCDENNNPISMIGPPGKDGVNGQDGMSPKINLSEDGVLQIEDAFHTISANIKGPKGDIGPQGIQGIQGLQGVQGEKGADGLTPVFEIADGSLKYKIGEQEWTSLITDKSIFTQPDIQTVLPENPTHGQIILWEGLPSMGIDTNFTSGCKYKYLAAGTLHTKTRLLGKAPNDISYTVFKVNSSSLWNLKKEILQSSEKVVTLSGTYGKAALVDDEVTLPSLNLIYIDGQSELHKITDSDKVKVLIDANPTETHWAVVELEEVLTSGTWIQIS